MNSGNVLFEGGENVSEDTISDRLGLVFGFPIPTMIRRIDEIVDMYNGNPFESVEVTGDIRLYVSFLKSEIIKELSLPWKSDDGSFRILKAADKAVFSVLELAISKRVKAMEVLEKFYGKNITTRNWNTIEKVVKKAGEDDKLK